MKVTKRQSIIFVALVVVGFKYDLGRSWLIKRGGRWRGDLVAGSVLQHARGGDSQKYQYNGGHDRDEHGLASAADDGLRHYQLSGNMGGCDGGWAGFDCR